MKHFSRVFCREARAVLHTKPLMRKQAARTVRIFWKVTDGSVIPIRYIYTTLFPFIQVEITWHFCSFFQPSPQFFLLFCQFFLRSSIFIHFHSKCPLYRDGVWCKSSTSSFCLWAHKNLHLLRFGIILDDSSIVIKQIHEFI